MALQHKLSTEFRSRTFIPLILFNNRLSVEWMTGNAAGDVAGEFRTDHDQGSS